MISHQNTQGNTPLHILASSVSNEDDGIKIATILMRTYKEEGSQSSSSTPPWRKQNEVERTPLSIAISRKLQEFAKRILEEDKYSVHGNKINVLSLAIENECHEVAVKILDIVNLQPQTDQLLTNVLHLAPLCTRDIYTRLIGRYPELIDEVDSEGNTILHSWMSRANCETQLVNHILDSAQRSSFIKLIYSRNYNSLNNPIHVAATNSKDTTPVVKLLVEAFRKEYSLKEAIIKYIPWFRKNKAGQGALQLAISQGNVALASYILSLRQDESYHSLLDYYPPKHSTLFLAIQNSCFQAAKQILEGLLKFKKKQISEGLDQNIWTVYLTNPSDGQNILHLAADLTDEVFGTYLVNQVPELSIVDDSSGKSPVDKAFEVGCTWFIEALLKKDSSMFQRNRERVPWANACANGHVSTLKAYINHDEEAFRDLCIVLKDSPLHYIRLPLKKYKEFFEDEFMQNFINLQNSEGQTPLHLAISKGDKILTEMLLNMNQIDYQIKDAKGESPIASLAKKYDEAEDNEAWKRLCYRTGIDPHVNMTYFHKGTDSAHVRSSLFVVAALFATITFPAGFTLPGGLDSRGNPVLGGNFAFLASLFSNALAFICSMLVLNILTWSMVTPYRRSELKLIDFSMVLLIIAFLLTTMAFGFGVFGVLAPKSLLPALLIALLMILLIILLLAPALHIWVKSSGISSLCSGSLASTLRCFAKKENPCDNEELNAGELRMQDELQPSS